MKFHSSNTYLGSQNEQQTLSGKIYMYFSLIGASSDSGNTSLGDSLWLPSLHSVLALDSATSTALLGPEQLESLTTVLEKEFPLSKLPLILSPFLHCSPDPLETMAAQEVQGAGMSKNLVSSIVGSSS